MVYEREDDHPYMPNYYYQQYPYYPEMPMFPQQPIYPNEIPFHHIPQIPPAYYGYEQYYPNVYPTSRPPGNVSENAIMKQFLDEQGQVDIQKMLKTISQFADTVQQVSPLIKQINELIRNFRS